MAIPSEVLECRCPAPEPGLGGRKDEPLKCSVLVGGSDPGFEDPKGLEFERAKGRLESGPGGARTPDERPEVVPGLRCAPPAGMLGMVDNSGFWGNEEGRTDSGADDAGFCSIWRSLASRAAILSFVASGRLCVLRRESVVGRDVSVPGRRFGREDVSN